MPLSLRTRMATSRQDGEASGLPEVQEPELGSTEARWNRSALPHLDCVDEACRNWYDLKGMGATGLEPVRVGKHPQVWKTRMSTKIPSRAHRL